MTVTMTRYPAETRDMSAPAKALWISIASVLSALALVACTEAGGEEKQVKIPQFSDTMSAPATVPTSSEIWTPTWSQSLPTGRATPTVKPPPPPPPPKTPVPTGPTIPTDPGGGPFVRQGEICDQEGAIGVTRSGRVLICKKADGEQRPRWRRP